MKPEFALSLTHDGIGLLQRSEDGWRELGAVDLASNDVETELANLRTKAEACARLLPFHTKLILPNTEILYEQIDVGGATGPDYEPLVREALEGRTPYALDELCYDYVVSGTTAQIAVVARETLIEAEDFAVAHKFNPVSFAAVPPKDAFAGEPMFGTTRAAEALLSGADPLERDAVPLVVVETADESPETKALDRADEKVEAASDPQEPEASDPAPAHVGIPPAPPAPEPSEEPRVQRAKTTAPREASDSRSRPGVLVALGLFFAAVCVGGLGVLLGVIGDTEPPVVTETVTQPTPQPALSSPTENTQDALPPAPVVAQDAPDQSTPPLPEPEPAPIETAVAPLVMPEMDSALVSPLPSSLTAFEQTPLPEEVAEGEEAVPESETQSIVVAPTTAVGSLAPAPIAGAGPGLLETETFYAVTGIWQRSPEQPFVPTEAGLDGLYIASLDAEISIDDALALPFYEEGRDGLFETPLPPFSPGLVFDLGEDGRVIATPEGALSPDGVMIFEGSGATRPPERPFNAIPSTDLDALAQLRPRPRPANATELVERATLDGRTRSELAALSPRPRPESAQQEALAAADQAPSALAVARAPAPLPRPSQIDVIVAAVRASQAQEQQQASSSSSASSTASLAAVAPAPQAAPALPTTASVARQATLENAMRLDRLNLIGVYGTSDDRRALVRTPSGRYLKLQVGDRLDGGRVAAIGEASLQYTKGSRNIVLEVPNS